MLKFFENKFDELLDKTKDKPFLHTLIDGLATFMFVPKATTSGKGVHIKDGMDLKRMMIHVVLPLTLCLILGAYNVGHQHYFAHGVFSELMDGFWTKLFYGLLQVIPLVVVTYVVGLGVEFWFASRKGHSIEEGYLVSGMLIPLIMPPDVPLWMLALAVIFAIIIGKEVFGGTGMNILNVALTARVFVFFAYPTVISGDDCWVALDYNWMHNLLGLDAYTAGKSIVDGWSGATPLALAAKGGWANVTSQYSVFDMFMGWIPGSVGEVCKPAIILGALFLVFVGIASWEIMLSMLVGAALMGLVLNIFSPGANSFLSVPWYYHLTMGGFLFAMAFMATDPVTAAQTTTGKYIYGFLIGICGMIIRVLNPAYPEGWMLAILFMNVFAPLIDHYIYQGNIKRRLARAKG